MTIVVQRAGARFVTFDTGWAGRYCFSYGEHYDAGNVSFGPLLACNEFLVEPGRGFDTHRHAGIEVVSWVLEGTLLHRHGDRVGEQVGEQDGVRVGAGRLQVLSSGTGVEHSETNPGPEPLRLLQMWLVPAEARAPAHAVVDQPARFGRVDLPLRQPRAVLHAGPLLAGERADLPEVADLFVFVAEGAVELAGERLDAGDSARLAGPAQVTALSDASLLAWAMAAG